jgi:Family of unknown function (DUF6152)
MKVRPSLLLGVVAVLVVGATPVLAHHSFAAEFDSAKTVTFSGIVTKVECPCLFLRRRKGSEDWQSHKLGL